MAYEHINGHLTIPGFSTTTVMQQLSVIVVKSCISSSSSLCHIKDFPLKSVSCWNSLSIVEVTSLLY